MCCVCTCTGAGGVNSTAEVEILLRSSTATTDEASCYHHPSPQTSARNHSTTSTTGTQHSDASSGRRKWDGQSGVGVRAAMTLLGDVKSNEAVVVASTTFVGSSCAPSSSSNSPRLVAKSSSSTRHSNTSHHSQHLQLLPHQCQDIDGGSSGYSPVACHTQNHAHPGPSSKGNSGGGGGDPNGDPTSNAVSTGVSATSVAAGGSNVPVPSHVPVPGTHSGGGVPVPGTRGGVPVPDSVSAPCHGHYNHRRLSPVVHPFASAQERGSALIPHMPLAQAHVPNFNASSGCVSGRDVLGSSSAVSREVSAVISQLVSTEQMAPEITRETSLRVSMCSNFSLFVCLAILVGNRSRIMGGSLDFVGISVLLNDQTGSQDLPSVLSLARNLFWTYRYYQSVQFGANSPDMFVHWLDEQVLPAEPE